MKIEREVINILTQEFVPVRLNVINQSHLHAGHAGDNGSGESHFRVEIVSARFDGQGRVERHRMVTDALSEHLKGPIHALSIKALAPSEDM